MRRSMVGWTFAVRLALLQCLASAGAASAHPLSRGALDVVVHPDRVEVRARVTVEEVVVTDMMTATDADPATQPLPGAGPAAAAPAALDDTYVRHARYLAAHLRVSADGGPPVAGRVAEVNAPTTRPTAATTTAPTAAGPDKDHAAYALEYTLAGRPRTIELRHDVLVGLSLAPGVSWEASYVVRIGVAGGSSAEGLLLTAADPLVFACDWPQPPAVAAGAATTGSAAVASTAPPAPARVDRGRMLADYLWHGVHHILSGYDHLLFISALVLAARGVWDLVKVVTAFTLAHTITLTLAALRLVHLPEGIVEPMIAASIVVVAAQNFFWPRQSHGWARLAVAFGFGLFHGLGFAGGLLDAMQSMSGVTIALAIVAFSIGVEVGHQLIVLPLFGALKLARRTRDEPAARDRVSLLTLRYGSAAIGVAGMYYLVVAVTSAVSVAAHS